MYTDLKRASGAAARIFEIVDREPKIPLSSLPPKSYWMNVDTDDIQNSNSRTGNVLTTWNAYGGNSSLKSFNQMIEGDIEFKNVTFKYPTRDDITILNDFNLIIKKGSHIGI